MKVNNLLSHDYNPDVLECLANLSNDEVFTPPEVANKLLDLLPQEIFTDPSVTFFDPACKSGVILREIAKRLIIGLRDDIPDLNERINHIYQKQLYGLAITELTSLISRRSLYYTKYPQTKFSVSKFDNPEGNIFFTKINHTWDSNTCIHCGASKTQFNRDSTLENHAYEFIHRLKTEEILKMKFDVVISNPPYHLETKGAGKQAKPIYNLFVEKAKKLNPKYLIMITPSRWFSGGMGLDSFRNEMMNDKHITKIVDFENSKECFPDNVISGGVNYFLRERDREGLCEFTNIHNKKANTIKRRLNEFPVVVRYNEGVSILKKIQEKNEKNIQNIVSTLMPYGLNTNYRGVESKTNEKNLTLHASNGITYISSEEITKGFETVGKYKVMIGKAISGRAGEPGKDGKFRIVTSSLQVIGPSEVCTHSYFTIGSFDKKDEAEKCLSYIKTKFVRFLMMLTVNSINLSKNSFLFVPTQDFSEDWNDEKLYLRYGLTKEEIDFIESKMSLVE